MLANLIDSAISSGSSTQVESLRTQIESTYQEFLTIYYEFTSSTSFTHSTPASANERAESKATAKGVNKALAKCSNYR